MILEGVMAWEVLDGVCEVLDVIYEDGASEVDSAYEVLYEVELLRYDPGWLLVPRGMLVQGPFDIRLLGRSR